MALTPDQIRNLDIAASRERAGTASDLDRTNLAYGRSQGYGAAAPTAQPLPGAQPVLPSQGAAPSSVFGSSLAGATSLDQITASVNAGQAAAVQAAGEPPASSRASRIAETAAEVRNVLGLGERPETPKLTGQFNDLRTQYGVATLEERSTALQAEADAIRARARERSQAVRDQPILLGTQNATIAEVTREEQDRLDAVLREQTTVATQLKSKYDVINSIMEYSKVDAQNAADSYDTQFTQGLNMINTIKGLDDSEKSDLDRTQDSARANLQIIYNQLTSGEFDAESLSPTQRASISRMELDAGLPQGFFTFLKNTDPKANILATTTRTDPSNNDYADLVMRDPSTGKIYTKSILLGRSRAPASGGGQLSDVEERRNAISKVGRQLQEVSGDDNFVSPENYRTARAAWVQSGFTADEFDSAFAGYVNPNHQNDYDIIRQRVSGV